MEKLRRYMEKTISAERAADRAYLSSLGISCTYCPEVPEEFDEFEFRTSFGATNIVITVAVEEGQIKRILFSKEDPEDPENIKGLTGKELREFLSREESRLLRFFDYLTCQDKGEGQA
ncbi:hypothetical protein [Desulfovirgula thermocuniculi]|uniref:hypothetical protein n=1 Tax=Desulfovirgula thermocuniculi TaxID=348842 RepID=UPI0004182838|nr:hypothetical protein [Desulfovirgula thermocuniculi]